MKKLFLILAMAMFGYCSYAQSYLPLTAGSGNPLTGDLHINKVTPSIALEGSGYGNSGAYFNLLGWAGTNNNWQIGVANIGYDGLMFTPSTTGGGSTFSTPAMVINSNGKVGIGTTSPAQKLTILMDASTNGTGVAVQAVNSGAAGSQPGFALLNPSGTMRMNGYLDVSSDTYNIGNASGSALMTINQSGNVGIGTTSPGRNLDLAGTGSLITGTTYFNSAAYQDHTNYKGVELGYDSSGQIGVIAGASDGAASSLAFWTYNGSGSWLERMRVSSNGNLLIGQTSQVNTAYKIDINGSARANEVVVNTTGADFVFDNKYRLPKLSEVKSYIDVNHHLPEIPSAEQMKKDGLSVGEMNTKLLQKVEELTLYLIDKDKQLTDQQQQIEQLNKGQEELKAALAQLTASGSITK